MQKSIRNLCPSNACSIIRPAIQILVMQISIFFIFFFPVQARLSRGRIEGVRRGPGQARRRRSFQTRSGSARRAAAKMNDIY